LGYDVMVTISNNERIQKTWAEEHGIRYDPGSWPTEIAAAQVAWFQPDLLFFTSHTELRPEWIKYLREKHPRVRLFGMWCGMPFSSIDVLEQFDLVLTCVPELDKRFCSLGCNSRHMHHAFDTRVLRHIDVDRKQDIRFSFIGRLIVATGFFTRSVLSSWRAWPKNWRSPSLRRRTTSTNCNSSGRRCELSGATSRVCSRRRRFCGRRSSTFRSSGEQFAGPTSPLASSARSYDLILAVPSSG
jgi:hypothetical protein